MRNHPNGQPIHAATSTRIVNSRAIRRTNTGTEAPSVLRIPSSLVRRSAENADNPNYRSPLIVGVTEGKVKSVEQQATEYREARKIMEGRENKRRFMSDPPLEYRQVDDPAKLTDLGETEAVKEKRRLDEAKIAGTGRKWWQLW